MHITETNSGSPRKLCLSSEPNAVGRLQSRALWVNTSYKCTFLASCSSPSVIFHAAPPQAKEGNAQFKKFARSASVNSNHATTFELSLNQNISVKITRG